jgi:hypothetical protein
MRAKCRFSLVVQLSGVNFKIVEAKDLETIAAINKLALNLRYMETILEEEKL